MDIWRSQGGSKNQTAAAAGLIAAGLVIMIALYSSNGLETRNGRAGLALGLLLLGIGGYCFLSGGEQMITVDPQARHILVNNKNRFGAKTRSISFYDVEKVLIGRLGKTSGYVIFYYLILKLRDGEEYSIFSPGWFEGGMDRSVVEGWRKRLEEYLSV